MRLSPNDPLVARASSAAKPPRRALAEDHEADLEADELALEAWDTAVIPQEQILPAQLGPTWLLLPYPPGVNSLYGHRVMTVKGRPMAVPYKTHEHREYMEHASAATLLVAPWPKDVELAVRVTLYRPRRVGDIDGPIKTLFDALNGRAWADDSQIVDLHVTRRDDKANPRVEVSIQPAAPTQE